MRVAAVLHPSVRVDGAYYHLGDLILDRQNIFQLPAIAFSPDIVSGCSVDELRGDAHPLAGFVEQQASN